MNLEWKSGIAMMFTHRFREFMAIKAGGNTLHSVELDIRGRCYSSAG